MKENERFDPEKILGIMFNIQADIIIGKHLEKHLGDIKNTVIEINKLIAEAKINDNSVNGYYHLKSDILEMVFEIYEQLFHK